MNRLSISKKVNEILGPDRIEWIKKFIIFCKQYLSIDTELHIFLLAKENEFNMTTGGFDPSNNEIFILSEHRAVVDICRTIAHEMVHLRQNLDNRINDPVRDGEDGSDIENEANAKAGEIIRKFGRQDKSFYLV